MNILLIGPGKSAIEHQDYAQFNNFDYKIGCRELLCDPNWQPLDYVVTYGLNDTRWTYNAYPEWRDRLVTKGYSKRADDSILSKFPFCPLGKELNYIVNDNFYSIQARVAMYLKATHITTIGWDILNDSMAKIEDTRYREDFPYQTIIVSKALVRERIKKIKGPLNTIITANPQVEWEHRTSVLEYS